jgi:hypothetical protein
LACVIRQHSKVTRSASKGLAGITVTTEGIMDCIALRYTQTQSILVACHRQASSFALQPASVPTSVNVFTLAAGIVYYGGRTSAARLARSCTDSVSQMRTV